MAYETKAAFIEQEDQSEESKEAGLKRRKDLRKILCTRSISGTEDG